MTLDETIQTLEEQKATLAAELQTLQVKQAQILRIKQLTDDIAKLKSTIHKIKRDEEKLKEQ